MMVWGGPPRAQAQSLSPMKADIVTFGAQGAGRIHLRNPYKSARRFTVSVFDENWHQVKGARLSNTRLALAPGATTSVFVVVPLKQDRSKTFYLCATSYPFYGRGTGMKGEVCGKYRIIRRHL